MRKHKKKSTKVFSIVSCVCMLTGNLNAAVFTWTGTTDCDLNTGSNYAPAGPPGAADSVTFDNTATCFTPTLSGLPFYGVGTFNVVDAGYLFAFSGSSQSQFSVGGVSNTSGSPLIFNITGVNPINLTTVTFANTASADNTGAANITYNVSNDSQVVFNAVSTASTGIFNVTSGANVTISGGGGFAATGGNATFSINDSTMNINNIGTAGNATITLSNTSTLTLIDSATAGNATITVNPGNSAFFNAGSTAGGATINAPGGAVTFNTSAVAGTSTINATLSAPIIFNNGTQASTSNINLNNSTLTFNNTSSAVSATIAATANSAVTFNNTSNAGTTGSPATIGLNASTLTFNTTGGSGAGTSQINAAAGSTVTFNNASTAGTTSVITATGASSVIFNSTATANTSTINTTASTLTFNGSSTAGSSTISAASGSNVTFNDSSNAGTSLINFADIGLNASTLTFNSTSSAGTSIIQGSNNSTILFTGSSTGATSQVSLSGSTLTFNSNSSAGALILANSGSTVNFNSSSTGNNATIQLQGGSILNVNENLTIAALQSLSSTDQINLSSNTLTFGNADSTLIAGVISGPGGSIIEQGTGTVTLTGANTYSGGTTINAGATLVVNTTSLPTSVVDNGTLVFNQTSNGTYSLNISGIGSFQKTGAGILTLSGVNTYSGTTTVSNGTLIGNTTSLPSVPTAIAGGAILTFIQNFDATFSGAFSGAGTLNLQGIGDLTLSGNSAAFTGTTNIFNHTILSGTLGGNITVHDDAHISGSGTASGNLTINEDGTITPATPFTIGTFNVGGNFLNNGGRYRVQIDGAGNSSLIDIGGTATVDGGPVHVTSPDGTFSVNTTYLILHADGGVTGNYDEVIFLLSPFVTFTLSQDFNNIYFNISPDFTSIFGLTVNQRHVAEQLDMITDPASFASQVLDDILQLPTPGAIRQVLDMLAGEQYTNFVQIAEENSHNFTKKIYHPMRHILFDYRDGECDYCTDINLCEHNQNRYTLWTDTEYVRTMQQGDSNSGNFDDQDFNVATGAQVQFDQWTLGIAAMYSHKHIRFAVPNDILPRRHHHSRPNGDANGNAFEGAFYYGYVEEDWYLFGTLTAGYQNYDVKRYINIHPPFEEPIDLIATSHAKMSDVVGYMEVGFNYFWSILAIQPFIALEVGNYHRNPISESGASDFNLFIFSRDQIAAGSFIGFHFNSIDEGIANFGMDVAWHTKFAFAYDQFVGQFQGFGTPFPIRGVQQDQNLVEGNIYVQKFFTENLAVSLMLEGEKSNNINNYGFVAYIELWW